MDARTWIWCGPSAFQFYRIPPCILEHVDNTVDLSLSEGRRALGRAGALLDYVSAPVRVLERNRARRTSTKGVVSQLWTGELPPGSLVELDAYHAVTSPAMTLLTLATHLSPTHLTMAVYELCGSFAVIRLLPEHRRELQRAINEGGHVDFGGWEPVRDASGNITDLWRRPSLVTCEELRALLALTPGAHGHKALARAVEEVCGVAASPLEVRAAMRLCGSRARGGEEFGPVALNQTVRFDAPARAMSGQDYAIVDLLFEETNAHPALAVECQGAVIHGAGGVGGNDANRLLGLQRMGIEPMLLKAEQLSDEYRYRHLVRLIAQKLGIPYREKTARQRERERELVRDLFIDWADLGR